MGEIRQEEGEGRGRRRGRRRGKGEKEKGIEERTSFVVHRKSRLDKRHRPCLEM